METTTQYYYPPSPQLDADSDSDYASQPSPTKRPRTDTSSNSDGDSDTDPLQAYTWKFSDKNNNFRFYNFDGTEEVRRALVACRRRLCAKYKTRDNQRKACQAQVDLLLEPFTEMVMQQCDKFDNEDHCWDAYEWPAPAELRRILEDLLLDNEPTQGAADVKDERPGDVEHEEFAVRLRNPKKIAASLLARAVRVKLSAL